MRKNNSDSGSETGARRSAIGRRAYLGAVGALATVPLFASSAAAVTRDEIAFDRQVDLVEAGADPTGEELIDDVIEDEAEDGTLLVVPDGEYAIRSVGLSDLQRFGIVAAEGANPRLVCQDQVFTVLSLNGGEDLLLEGLTIVQGDGNSGAVGIDADGDFRCRNILKDGVHFLDSGGFRFSVGDEDATGVIENCAAPDGFETNPEENDKAGIFVNERHAGELWFYDCHVEGFQDNGLYASNPGAFGEDGPVHVRGGLWKNNNISGIRLASTGSTVKGAVVVNDESIEFANTTNRRGIRMRNPNGNHVVEDCDIIQRDVDADGPVVIRQPNGGGVVRNCRILNDSDAPAIRLKGDNEGWSAEDIDLTGDGNLAIDIPATDVCRGSDCEEPDTSENELDRTLRVQADGEGADYEFTVSGDLRAGPDADGGDDISGSTAIGGVGGTGSDDYTFSGAVTGFQREGPLTLFIDGEEVDPDSIGDDDSDDGGSPDRTLRVEAVGEGVDYEFTVSGELQAGPDADGGDDINGSTAIGGVGGTSGDDFSFSGDVTDFQRDGPLALFIDGEEVDPDSIGDDDTGSRTIVIEAPNGVAAEYTLEVSGDLEKSEAMGGSVNANDEVSGSFASGQVNGGTDSYAFGGDIEYLSIDPPLATVFVDGEEIDSADVGLPNRVVIDDSNYDGAVDYEFTVDGDLAVADSPAGDSVDDSTATGRVVDNSDGYYFSGEITDFTASRATDVLVNGELTDLGGDASGDGDLLVIERAPDSSGSVDYIIETTGQLEKTDENGASINSADEIDNGKAGGVVLGATDAYRITDGEVTDVSTFGGEVVTTLNGETVDYS